jgi:chaperonin GroES
MFVTCKQVEKPGTFYGILPRPPCITTTNGSCASYCPGYLRKTLTDGGRAQASQATFKSIKSLVPLLDRVLVQRFKPETVSRPSSLRAPHVSFCTWRSHSQQKTASGIFLPTSATTNPLPEATVIAVGPGAPNKDGQVVPTIVKAGDRVLLPGWGGNAIKVGDEVRLV